jgi:hypothetical protein
LSDAFLKKHLKQKIRRNSKQIMNRLKKIRPPQNKQGTAAKQIRPPFLICFEALFWEIASTKIGPPQNIGTASNTKYETASKQIRNCLKHNKTAFPYLL